MTFAFISHAQPDKARPDGRMRCLARYLYDAGIPIWIDRPEELGFSARDLEDRCVALNGVWTNDIRDALNRCAAGVGIWSLHAGHRLRQDANGVLFQELNALSLTERLHLVSIDPGIAKEANQTFKHLAHGQQVIDLGAVDRAVFARRAARLVEALATATKTKAMRIKPYVAALSENNVPSGIASLLQPERKRARELADALRTAFASHDPGRLPITLSRDLAVAYERMLESCKRENVRFRTYHRLLALTQLPSRFVQECFDEVESGLGARIESWLSKQSQKKTEAYVSIDISVDALAQAAAVLAEAERAPAIDERHAFLSILTEGASGTAAAIRESIGADKFHALTQVTSRRRPRSQSFSATTSLDGLDS